MGARGSDVFVGRASELEALERALDVCRGGTGTTVLVSGEAGIGKTRLASELAQRARDAGFDVLLGRSIDLVGTELPYQPFLDALRPLAAPRQRGGASGGSQLQVFEATLALLHERSASAPLLLVLEDLHWADASSLDLVVFLAHNIGERPILVLATHRAGEPASAHRMRRLADGVRRSGAALFLELAPLGHEEIAALVAAHVDEASPAAAIAAIVARSEGNPFFAEELLAAGSEHGELPDGLRDLLLQRFVLLDAESRAFMRVAAAAGRDVGYQLLCALSSRPEHDVRESLRQAVERGVLVADQPSGSFRFRHPLLAEAVYSTILPGEREELHARLADELSRSGDATAAELAPHWEAARRPREALVASVEAAREAEAVFGLSEAHGHLERAITVWSDVPDAAELIAGDLAGLCAWAATLAGETGEALRAVELARRAIELVGPDDPHRAALLHVHLAEYLHASGKTEATTLEALQRAVQLAPPEPPSAERAYALGSLAGGLMLIRHYAESLPLAEEALELSREVGAREAEVRALTVIACDLVSLDRAEKGLDHFRRALVLAEEARDLIGLERAYTNLTNALMLLGRTREAARQAEHGLAVARGYGMDGTLIVANLIDALIAGGEWRQADRVSTTALRAITASFPHVLLMLRAELEVGLGDFDAARAHLDAALHTLPEDHDSGIYDVLLAELALWERRWTDAAGAVGDALARASFPEAALLRVWFCAKGLRAQAELAALARARRDDEAATRWCDGARDLIGIARAAGADAVGVDQNAAGWLALAEAEHLRARGIADHEVWSDAAACWDRLERPPLAAYCRWREAEALVAAGASRTEAGVPLRDAHAVAMLIAAVPLRRELELLAQRARLDLVDPNATSPEVDHGLESALGVTTREAEVLALVARGYTNREIAAALVISTKTASVHVSHILRKLGASNRREAAAIAHRVAPPPVL